MQSGIQDRPDVAHPPVTAKAASPTDDRIVSQLYEAAAGLLPWPTALTALSRAFDAMVVQYVTFDVRTDRLIGCEQPEGVVVDAVLDYMREYNRLDPHVRHLANLPLGTAIDTEDVFPARQMTSHRFYREFWAPYGVRGMLAGKIDESEQHFSCIGIVRSVDRPRFSADQLAVATSYIHHLSVAFRIARRVHDQHLSSRVGRHLMEQADRPMFLVGADHRLLFANAAGRVYLDEGDALAERDGRIHARTAKSEQDLRQHIDGLSRRTDWIPRAPPRIPTTPATRSALRIRGRSGRVALCTLWNLEGDAGTQAFGDTSAILLSVAHPLLGDPPDANFVGAMLDLTPAEARLATLLVLGHDVAAIATMLDVSVNTLRTQLRSIYGKTDTRRQAELIRLISRACAP